MGFFLKFSDPLLEKFILSLKPHQEDISMEYTLDALDDEVAAFWRGEVTSRRTASRR